VKVTVNTGTIVTSGSWAYMPVCAVYCYTGTGNWLSLGQAPVNY